MAVTLTLPTVDGDEGDWGDILNAALNTLSGFDVFKRKTADESVTSSTTVQDDDHMVAMTLAVGSWIYEGFFLASGAAAGDFKVGMLFSGTGTGWRAGAGPAAASTDVLGATAQPIRSAASGNTAAGWTTAAPYGVDGTNWSYIHERGLFVVTVAGDLKVQWAQNASSGTATVLRQGSYAWLRRVE